MLNNNLQNIFIKFVLWLALGISIMIIGITDVFAEQVNVGYIGDQTQFLLGIPNLGAPVTLPIQTNNSYGNIFQVWINVNNISLNKDYIYQVEISTPNSTFTNINSVDVTTNGSQICNFLGFSDASINYPKIYFQCPTSITNGSLSISIYNNSGSTSSIVTNSSTFRWNYTYLRYFTDDDDIDFGPIISNQTNNTNNIINNQNQNTQDIINSNKVCTQVDKNNIVEDGYLTAYNGIYSSDVYGITGYINIYNADLKVLSNFSSASSGHTCFYNINKTMISCLRNDTLGLNTSVTLPSNTYYFRTSIHKNNNLPTFEYCKNGNQALDDSINDLNSSLTDSSPVDMSSLGNTAGWLPAGPIDSIINLPLNLFNNLLTALNGTCSPLHIKIPYLDNKYIDIPCISTIFNQIEGLPAFWNWVGVISSVVILYRYLLALYKYYDDLTTLKANFITDFGGAP